MARTAHWPWWQQYTGSNEYRIRELLRAILDLHGYFGDPNIWLWRGQANSRHTLCPGVHTRVERSGIPLDDFGVKEATKKLLAVARSAHLDRHEGAILPDLALLAHLQHHGAATPLMDVSLDPLVALYMATVSPNVEDDDRDGVLFAIRKPENSETIPPFDARSFSDVYDGLPDDSCVFYEAPEVSDRLRIQRGYFLISKVSEGAKASIAVSVDADMHDSWISKRMHARGKSGKQPVVTSDIATFRLPKQFKPEVKKWLEDRTGLTEEYVYPTVWHQPHQEGFARSQGRLAVL